MIFNCFSETAAWMCLLETRKACVCDHFFICLCVAVFRKAALLFGWAVFLLLAYKVSKLDREYQEYNPYEVLNLDPVINAHNMKSSLL